ncbi:TPA: MucBP domain-containing protein, partial [Streptococcus suis]|nr:MucBP domain-containing protein [Streptococcus suis]
MANTVEPDTLPQLILEAQPKDEGEGLLETGAEFLESSVPVEVSTEGDTLTPVETVTEETQEVVERTATINYIVQYLLEDGTLVDAVVKTTTVTTTDALAKTTVEVVAELPEGYELVEGQVETTSQEVTEGAENLVTIKVVKKAEVATTTTAAPAATTTTTAPATPVATTPVTVEEGKVVLEQNISEAVVLSDEANRLYAAAPEGNESLKTAADATKLAATEATTVLKDSVATLEQVNAQIDAVRTNVEALALELRKRDEDGVLTVRLAATTTSPLGTGTGVQLVSGTTVSPSMDDANGASVDDAKSGSLKATEVAGYYTFKFIQFGPWYDGTVGVERGFGGSSTNGSYMRASAAQDGSEAILVEWVDKDGNLLESHMVNPTESVDFTHFQAQALNTPVVVSYTTQSASELVLGTLHVTYKGNTVQTNSFIPKVISNTTSYVTTDGTVLATYSMATMPGLTTTPSDKRTFSGYEFVETKTDTVALAVPEGAAYVEQVRNGYPLNWNNGGPYIQYKTIVRPVDNGKAVIKEVWIADPNYQGTHDYLSTTEEGFIRILTTSKMGIGETNTNFMLDPGLIGKYPLTTNAGGTTTTVTQVSQLNLNDIKSKDQWFFVQFRHHTKELARINIQPTTIGKMNAIDIHYARELAPGEGAVTTGITLPITLRYTGTTYTETTHVYRPLPQRALIIYKTDQDVQLGDIDEENGNPGESIDYSTTARINAYKLAGYELVSDGGPQSGQDAIFDFTNDDATDPSQKFYVILKERVVDIPNAAVPGQPVDPNDPNSPKWPTGVDALTRTEEVTRTITYVNEAGDEVATPFTDRVTFERKAFVNLVTGEITYGDWVAVNQDNVLDGNPLPEVTGYSVKEATKNGAEATPISTTVYAQVTAETADIVEKVVYVQDTQTAKITISTVDANGGNKTEYATVNETGKHTEPVATTTVEEKLLELKRKGYDVETKVTDTFLDSAKTFDNVKDAADQPSQSYEIVVKPRIVDIPKDVVPGQPVDPNDPNSPKWPAGVDQLQLTEEVTRTITYVNEAGEEVSTPFTTTVNFTRTAQVNLVTGDITYGAWTADNADNVLDGNVLPEVPGYTATTATKDGADVTPASTTVYAQVAADSADIVEKVVYVQDTQTAKITISTVDANGENKTEYATVDETGKHTEPVATTTVEEKLLELKRKGYDVETKVTDTFLDSAKTFDNVKDTADQPSQSYEIVVKERIVDIPKDVVPGQPVDPTDPNSPVWPAGVDNLTLTEEVTRTITYVDEAGNEVATTFTDKVTFTRTAQVNLVTGDITYGAWTADNADSVLDGNVLPEVPGYTATTATKDGADVTPASTTVYAQVTADSADIVEKVVYVQDTQTAKITISTVDAKGENKTEYATVDETGKHTEPVATTTVEEKLLELKRKGYDVETKVTDTFLDSAKTFDNVKDATDQPSQVYEIVVKERVVDIPKDVVPGQPVDPTDPNSPVWPAGVDNLTLTEEVTRTITYVDEAGNEVATTFTEKVTFTRTVQVNLVTGEITYSDWTADNGDNVLAGNPLPTVADHQVSTATKDGVAVLPASTTTDVTVAADSADIVEKVVYVKDKGSVTIQYKDTDGNVIKAPVIDEDNVAVGTAYDTTNEGDKPTVIPNADGTKYVLVPSLTEGAETGTVVKDGTTVTYVYQKVANWIPVIPDLPENERPVLPYPFDPEKPDQPLTPTPDTVIPYVPGYVPVGPDGKTPLTPVDKEDPSKGYTPPTPSTPGDNTYIPYVKVEKGSVLVAFVDEAGSPIKSVVTDTDNAEVGTSYDTTDQKEDVIKANGFTYYFKEVKAGSAETGKVVEGVTTVTYVYTKVANWIPVIPGLPENERPVFPYPFDPTNPDKPIDPTTPGTVIPYVPGYVPVGPDGTTPLTPVDPEDPSKGYVPPTPSTPGDNTYIPYMKAGSVVVKYQDTDGKELIAPVVDENNVKVGTAYDTTDQKKTEIKDAGGNRYVLVPSKTVGSETGEVTDGTTEVIYVYQKVANWIPQIPGVPTDQLPKTSYPFDPEKPTDPITGIPTNPTTDKPVVPFVDGYTPVDPATNTPLTPVDETDLTKGYIPPTVTNPGKDTLIPYVQDKGSVTIQYKDTDGNVIKDPVTDEDNVVVGTPYDTTDEGDKPTEIVTKNGSRYVLVPSKTEGAEKGKVAKNGTTVTYVYQKV